MSNKLPAHAGGTAKAGDTPTVPAAPVKDHSRDAEQLAPRLCRCGAFCLEDTARTGRICKLKAGRL